MGKNWEKRDIVKLSDWMKCILLRLYAFLIMEVTVGYPLLPCYMSRYPLTARKARNIDSSTRNLAKHGSWIRIFFHIYTSRSV